MFPENVTPATGGVPSELPPSVARTFCGEANIRPTRELSDRGRHDNLRVFPAPASTTDASMQLARQVARLLAEAKQQIQALVHETATQSVAAERNIAAEQWEQKYAAFREEVARETAHAIDTIQQESSTSARTAQAAAAESLKEELPRWLAPQLEQMTHELTAQLAREGALQREQQEKQFSTAHETLADTVHTSRRNRGEIARSSRNCGESGRRAHRGSGAQGGRRSSVSGMKHR